MFGFLSEIGKGSGGVRKRAARVLLFPVFEFGSGAKLSGLASKKDVDTDFTVK